MTAIGFTELTQRIERDAFLVVEEIELAERLGFRIDPAQRCLRNFAGHVGIPRSRLTTG